MKSLPAIDSGAGATNCRHAIRLLQTGEAYVCSSAETLLQGMARIGKKGIPAGCLNGGCGVCKVVIRCGTVRKAGAMSRAHISEGSVATPKSNLYWIGASYPVTSQFTVDGQIFRLDFKNSANEATLFALRGTYALSKRTAVYGTMGRIGNDGALAISASGGAAGGAPAAGNSQTGVMFGVRHAF